MAKAKKKETPSSTARENQGTTQMKINRISDVQAARNLRRYKAANHTLSLADKIHRVKESLSTYHINSLGLRAKIRTS